MLATLMLRQLGCQRPTEDCLGLKSILLVVADVVEVDQQPLRDRAIDLLRALALARVVLWHATGWAALTWIAAIPVMVFVTGTMLARSLSHRGTTDVIRNRLRRLLLPLWVYSAAVWVVMVGVEVGSRRPIPWRLLPAWVLPVTDPQGTAWSADWLSQPLWYLRLMVWLLAALPVLAWAARRAPVVTVVLCAVGTVVGELAWGSSAWLVQDLVTFSAFLVAGLAVGDGRLPALGSRWIVALPLGVLGAAIWVLWPGVESAVANDSHVLVLMCGAATLGLAGAGMTLLRRLADRWVHVVELMSRRSLSIYLWHCAAIASVMWLTEPWRAWVGDSSATRLLVAVFAAVATSAVVWVVGPVEDVAARRPAVRERSRRAVLPGLVTMALLLALLPGAPSAAGEAFVLPVPSQAPEPGDYSSRLAPGPPALEFDSAVDSPADNSARQLAPIPQFDDLADAFPASQSVLLDQALDSFATEWAPGGLRAIVVRPGTGRWSGGAGRSPVGADQEQALESVTKSFTATLVLRAVDAGLIQLDDTVGTLSVAPWFTPSTRVTYRQLLSHRSGIVNYRNTPTWAANPKAIDGWESALRATTNLWRSEPSYSSTNYIVAALALEQLLGRPIEQLISDDLLEPLQLDGTSVDPPAPGRPNTGTAGVSASPTDLARWATALWRDGSLLSPAMRQVNTTIDPADMFAPGSVGMCPCWSDADGELHQSGVGYYGGTLLVRYDRVWDTVVVLVSSSSIWGDGESAAFTQFASTLAEISADESTSVNVSTGDR